MTEAKTKESISEIKTLISKTRRMVLLLTIDLCVTFVAMMPFILIEDQSKSEFWQSVGYYGVFLIGLSSLAMVFSPRKPRL